MSLRRFGFTAHSRVSMYGISVALLTAGVLTHSTAIAGSASANLSVTATVSANCTISTSPVSFGAFDTINSGNLDNAGSVAISCTKGASTTLTLGLGQNTSGTTRRMTNGTDFISYELYQPSTTTPGAACAYSQVWGGSGAQIFTPTTAPSNASRTYSICGRTSTGQNVGVGSYVDTVAATVNF